nr:MAG TPA: hypothetical protein [Caudoviricetes sp.]
MRKLSLYTRVLCKSYTQKPKNNYFNYLYENKKNNLQTKQEEVGV